jgi:hypothetical protein
MPSSPSADTDINTLGQAATRTKRLHQSLRGTQDASALPADLRIREWWDDGAHLVRGVVTGSSAPRPVVVALRIALQGEELAAFGHLHEDTPHSKPRSPVRERAMRAAARAIGWPL